MTSRGSNRNRGRAVQSRDTPAQAARRLTEPYVYRGKRPSKTDTYVLDGPDGQVVHRFDGACHDECENVR